jgi:hypothetical protein
MQQLLGREVEMPAAEDRIIARFAEVFELTSAGNHSAIDMEPLAVS